MTLGVRPEHSPAPSQRSAIDLQALAKRLARDLEGEVRFDDGSRALYATDASNYRQVPLGVVLPKSAEDIVAGMAACREFGAPVLARGGGTSLAGQCCNVAVMFDMSKYYNRVLEIDAAGKTARVQPGVVLDTLRHEAERYGLTFGPDPATHDHCTLGGMLGNNSCGVHSVMAQFRGGGQRTADNTLELDVLTYDGVRLRVGETSAAELAARIAEGGRVGEIYSKLAALRDDYAELIRTRYPHIPRRVSGYNLDELLPEKNFNVARALVGSESTCVLILEAKLALLPAPRARSLLLLGYPDVYSAADHVCEVLESQPIGLEGMDRKLIGYMQSRGLYLDDLKLLPAGDGWLLVEFGGDSREDADAQAKALMGRLRETSRPPTMRLFDDPAETKRVWEIREAGLGATAFVANQPDSWPGWEDSAVPPERVGDYLRDLRRLFDKFGYDASLYGHFGQGCVHCRIPFNLVTRAGIDDYLHFTDEAADLVLRYGGSLSGEHGDGQARGELLPKMFGPELYRAFVEFKSIWDPAWRMNPGKVVEAAARDEHMRLGTSYEPAQPATHFAFPVDDHNFARAALRCVGVGKCRHAEGGVMCPSFMATREERHSTRGRARLLFEMLRGEVITEGWRSPAVREALELCLACKGCRNDCPVNVDMASYKAEFMAHHFEGRLRPAHMYVFGRIRRWSELAARAPRFANALLGLPWIAAAAKRVAGIAPQRRMPTFAVQTFRQWFEGRPRSAPIGPRVLLWPDTFHDYFHPEVAQAATRVLEQAGFEVAIPSVAMCCGRPLYDCGWLPEARRRLEEIIRVLQTDIRNGTPLVMLEPSCCAVFRDELVNLMPHDPDARRLSRQTFMLSEFLMRRAPDFAAHGLQGRRALVHLHCHHRAVMSTENEETLLRNTGLEVHIPEEGCCGMAGPFGFRDGEPYEVSIACAERRLLPAVRAADRETLVVADGYSCREQIAQLSGRRALHLAEVLVLATARQAAR